MCACSALINNLTTINITLHPVCSWVPASQGQEVSLSICLSLHWDANQSTGTTTLVNSSSLKFISEAILFSQASADKLSLEMQEFGFPPVFPSENGVENDSEEEIADPTKRVKKVGMTSSDFSQ